MSKPDPSLLYLDPEKNGPFVIKEKPNFTDLPMSDTMTRLKAFLPMMKQANEELELRVQQDPNFEGCDIIETGDSEEEEEYDESEGSNKDGAPSKERKDASSRVVQMDLMLVPEMSDSGDEGDEEANRNVMDSITGVDSDSELIGEDGNVAPQMVQDAQKKASQLRAKPKIEEVERLQKKGGGPFPFLSVWPGSPERTEIDVRNEIPRVL